MFRLNVLERCVYNRIDGIREKCFELLRVGVRNTSTLNVANPKVRSRRRSSITYSGCLIDSTTISVGLLGLFRATVRRMSTATNLDKVKKTCLYDLHVKNAGK